MREGVRNVQPKQDPGQQKQTLKFFFTPAAQPPEELQRKNPLAKQTTFVPEVLDALRAEFGEAVLGVTEYANEHTVYVERERIVDVCRFLKEAQGFTYLSD